MYGRVTGSIYASCKCSLLSTLTLRHQRPIVSCSTRWVSQATNQQTIADEIGDDTASEENRLSNTSNGPRQIRFRRWRPHESTELGVDSLGKPAEVLILPSRERRLPGILPQVEDDRDGVARPPVESDNAPLLWEQIAQNIIAVRDTIVGREIHNATAAQLKELRKVLSKGFTKNQLRKYLTEKLSPTQLELHIKESSSKKSLASCIIQQVWDLKDVAEETSTKEGGALLDIETKPTTTKTLRINSTAFDLALLREGRLLREVSVSCGVQIDAFRGQAALSLTGDAKAVSEARKRLGRLVRPPYITTVQLPEELHTFLHGSHFGSYLKHLTQKHAVRIVRKGTSLTVYSLNRKAADFVRQALANVAKQSYRNCGYTVFDSSHKLDTYLKAKVYPSDLGSWFLEQQIWYRHIEKLHLDNPAISDQGFHRLRYDATKVVEQRLTSAKLSAVDDLMGALSVQSSNIRHEYSAELGFALFNSEKSAPQALLSAFCPNLPWMPQVLASGVDSLAISSEEQQLMLRFLPCGKRSRLPTFLIYMVDVDMTKGLNQNLRISKIDLDFGSAIHDVLLPNKQADIRMRKQLVVKLFDLADGAPTPQHLPLLKTLSNIVQEIQLQDKNKLSPLRQLDLAPLIQEAHGLAARDTSKIVDDKSVPPSRDVTGLPLSEEIIKVLSTIKQSKSDPVLFSYTVETPQWLDIARYTDPNHSDLVFEHTISRPASTTTNRHDHGHGHGHEQDYESDEHHRLIQTLRILPSSSSFSSKQSTPQATLAPEKDDDSKNKTIIAQILHAAVEFSAKLTDFSSLPNKM